MATTPIVPTAPAAPHESFFHKIGSLFTHDGKEVLTVLEQVGKDALKGLDVVERYLPTASALASIVFPSEAAGIAGVVNSVSLIQQAVVTVEQKMAAGGMATGTGAQKLADVISLVTPTVSDLLNKEGVPVNQERITKIVNAVVAILNVQTVSVPAAPTTPAA